MEKGTLVEFRVQGDERRRLGVVDRPDGKSRWFVVDERGQSHSLAPRQITYEVPGQSYKPTQIPSFLEQVKPYIDPSSLEVAWELLVEEGETSVTPVGMANLLFSESEPSHCYAAHCLLSEDKLYFKQKGDGYEARTAAQVAERKHQLEVEALKQRSQQEFLARVSEAIKGESVDWQRHDIHRLEALEKYAALLADMVRGGLSPDALSRAYPPPGQVLDTLNILGRPATPQGAFQLLVDLSWWSPHENLFLRRSSIPVQFPAKVIEVAQQRLDSPPPDQADRLDLTHLKVYTIDDESTSEIDDGLSWELLPDERERLWVHIADPTRLLVPEDELDLEARKRASTVYLPTGMVPMFPPALATGPMSLIQGRVCCALSFGIILDETGAVQEYSIHTSLIKPTYRLTYEDVDEMLELGVQAEPEIAAIATWAQRRKAWRDAQGAVSINMPEAMIKVKNEEICIDLLEDSIARQLVAEMMILAGEVAARYGQANNIPLPFRGQPQPELPSEGELLQLPAGAVRACAMRRCMPKSEMSINPLRHAGLGLDTYTQATSPIRRYSDLLTHFQLKAHLRGEVLPFSAEQLKEVMMTVSTATQEVTMVERQTNRYWALEYLRRHTNEVWRTLVLMWLREDSNLALILLEDLGLQLPMVFKRSVKLGEQILVKVIVADPQKDVIQFQEVTYSEAVQLAAK